MNAIEIKGLTKSYGDFTLDHLNLTLPSGCIMGLVGENGAGKSTTIKLILEIIQKDSGSISLFGKEKLTKDDIGVVLDEVGISAHLNTRELGKIMKYSFKNWDMDTYNRYLVKFSLPEKKKFKDFSRGMKMKLGIAVALSHGAKLLILDEATSGLDPVIRDEILDIFIEFTRNEEHSILISSHIVSDLEKICDYIAFLHKGMLLLCEEKDVLREQYGFVHGSADVIDALPRGAIVGQKTTPYGMEAIIKRNEIPSDMEVFPVDIEQLFIFMTKEADTK